ncbi:MAG: DMT family transporter [Clostridiaceae bacterium]|nr:DMT family transporter [Clostridiaceae bacterium]
MYNILSMFVGILIGLMTVFNSILSTYMGNYTSTVIIHLAGFLGVIFILLITKSKLSFNKNISLITYSAGVVGVFTVLFNNLTVTYIGAALTTAIGLLGQTLSSIIIDHYGLLGVTVVKFNKKKLIGLSLILAGIGIMTFL